MRWKWDTIKQDLKSLNIEKCEDVQNGKFTNALSLLIALCAFGIMTLFFNFLVGLIIAIPTYFIVFIINAYQLGIEGNGWCGHDDDILNNHFDHGSASSDYKSILSDYYPEPCNPVYQYGDNGSCGS